MDMKELSEYEQISTHKGYFRRRADCGYQNSLRWTRLEMTD
jgi:hypothetical protein